MGTHPLTKFHEDWTINVIVASRVLTHIIKKNLLTKFHEDPAKKLAWKSIKLGLNISKKAQNIIGTNLLTKFHEDWTINVAYRVLTRKNAPPLVAMKNAPPRGGHVFQPTGIIFELVQDIIGMNLLTKFHEDWTINVVSRVKNAPPHGSHVFQANVTIFEPIQDINKTNLLTIRAFFSFLGR
ncbi:hypothetical protein DPMN_126285 [Dreissena polymorpha]|uniref:Uncharacterized protein n=1 Tax=Dreissena polymorpha TaxID=45954 RepID=A0A9D4JVG4_DREPO|nr:hypothetical protein DPMN_126285 [Dreissena polymorpha]